MFPDTAATGTLLVFAMVTKPPPPLEPDLEEGQEEEKEEEEGVGKQE